MGNCYHKEQLDEIITSSDIHNYAYILHDKCKQDPNNPESELKKPHYHFLVQFARTQRGSWFKAFSDEDLGIVFVKRVSIPVSAYNYLIHDTPACWKEKKFLYDPSERIGTIDPAMFETEEEKEEDEHKVLLSDLELLLKGEISWRDVIYRAPKRLYSISSIRTTADLMARDNRFANEFRNVEVTYIYGETGKGKTRYVAQKHGYKNIFRVTKSDPKTGHTVFDGYRGQDVLVFEEFRSSFKIEDMLNYLDGHPMVLPSRYNDKDAVYTKVYILSNWTFEQQYKNIQSEHPGTWRAFCRRIQNIYNFDGKRDRNLKVVESSQIEMVPIADDNLPF